MKQILAVLLFVLSLLSINIPAAIAASFDCAKAGTFVEKLICNTSILGQLDIALSENYRNIRAANIGDGARANLVATQREWIKQRNSCLDAACIERIYRARLDEICSYPVLSGTHPPCKYSSDIGAQSASSAVNTRSGDKSTSQSSKPPKTSTPEVPKSSNKELTVPEKAGVCAGYHSGYAIMSDYFGHRTDRDYSVQIALQLDARYDSFPGYKALKDFAFKALTDALQNKNTGVFAEMIAICQQIGAPTPLNTGR